MERVPIGQENRGTVELAIMVEAGTVVREMGTMTKERRERAFFEEYMSLLSEIPHEMLDDEETRHAMKTRFKGMRKGDMNANNLLRKYETELTALKNLLTAFQVLWTRTSSQVGHHKYSICGNQLSANCGLRTIR